MDRAWLLEKVPMEKNLKMATSLKIKGIRSSRHKSDEFVSMSLYFSTTDLTNCLAYTYIYQKLYIVERLKANLLISNNILAIKRVIIDLASKSAMISSCQMTISVAARPRGYLVQKKVLVNKSLTISLKSKALVQFVYSSLPDDRDFLFNPIPYSHLTPFSHIPNNSTCRVLVRNALHQLVLLFRRQ